MRANSVAVFLFSVALLSFSAPLHGQFVYATTPSQTLDDPGTVAAFTIDGSTGALTAIPGSPFATGPNPTAIAVDPSGRFAYVDCWYFDQTSQQVVSTVWAYRIDANTGALAPIPGSPFPEGNDELANLVVDTTGKFLYVLNLGPYICIPLDNPPNCGVYGLGVGSISGFAINNVTGALTVINGSPFPEDAEWNSELAVDPAGKFLYSANIGLSEGTGGSGPPISGFSIDPATGALTRIPGSPFFSGEAEQIAINPLGTCLYVYADFSVGELGIDPTTGSVLFNPSSCPTAPQWEFWAVEPTTRFAYVSNYFGISAERIDPSTGGFTPIPGSPLYPETQFNWVTTSPLPPVALPDTIPPSVSYTGTIPGPPKQVQMASFDRQSGLASVQIVKCTNCTAATESFPSGTTYNVLTTATKVDPSKSSAVQIKATDLAGNSTLFDPVDVTIEGEGGLAVDEVVISAAEHLVQVTNGSPGIHHLLLKVGGINFVLSPLENGEVASRDIGFALKPGGNVAKIFSYGRRGADASIVFTQP